MLLPIGLLNSCDKKQDSEPIYGCTDDCASNYNQYATPSAGDIINFCNYNPQGTYIFSDILIGHGMYSVFDGSIKNPLVSGSITWDEVGYVWSEIYTDGTVYTITGSWGWAENQVTLYDPIVHISNGRGNADVINTPDITLNYYELVHGNTCLEQITFESENTPDRWVGLPCLYWDGSGDVTKSSQRVSYELTKAGKPNS